MRLLLKLPSVYPERSIMSSGTPSLPSIDQFPNADVVLYDGDCRFCTNSVRQLKWIDGKNRLAFLSIHDPRTEQRYPDLTFSQLMEQMYLIPARHPTDRYGGAAAIRYLTRRLPRLWIFAPLLHLPGSLPVWQWLYRQVAIRRYRIAQRKSGEGGEFCGEEGTCHLHFPDRDSQVTGNSEKA